MKRRHGSMLFGVLLVVVLATLVASTAFFRVRNNTDIVRASIREDASRTLLRSGIRAYMAEFAQSRPDLLGGGLSFGVNGPGAAINPLRVSDGMVISETGRRRGIVRLLAHPSGALFVPESTRIDLNRATRDMLLALPNMTDSVADAIVARRSSRPFESVEELLGVDGVTLEFLYGDLEIWAERYVPANEALERQLAIDPVATEPVLADLVTVFSADANVVSRVTSGDSSFDPFPRLLLPDEVLQRDGETLVLLDDAIDLISEQEADRLDGATDVLSLLQRLNQGVGIERWAPLLDVITTDADPYQLGRVDLTNAPEAVLASLPGLAPERIADILQRRSELTDAVLARITWPIEEGILTVPEYFDIAPWITNRSLQFRLIIEAGYEVPTEQARSGDFAELELEHRIVAEVVIDVSGDQPRVAYLRDVTWLADSIEIHTAGIEEQARSPEDWYDFGDPFAPIDFGTEPEADDRPGFVRPSERADRQRREMRERRPTTEDPRETEQRMPAGPQAEGRDRRIGRWNGEPRSGGN